MTELNVGVPLVANAADPLWSQAVTLISERINSGELREGDRLPAERDLCAQLEISRVTLRRALGKLVEDGILEASHGRGWFVSSSSEKPQEWSDDLESFTEAGRRMGVEVSSKVLVSKRRGANLDEAELLSIVPGTPVFQLVRLRFFDDVPIATDESVIPAALVPDIDSVDFSHSSLFDVLSAAGNAPERSEAALQARAADTDLAQMLVLELGDPILEMRQTTFGFDGKKIATSRIRYAGDRYRMKTSFSRRRP
ncbi:MAG: GntR family transcriptional regulator [Scrofimicrobium sp.]